MDEDGVDPDVADVDQDEEDDDFSPSAPGADQADEMGYYVTPELNLSEPGPAGVPLRSLNDEAVWTLTSARPGEAIDELLDPSTEKFWQSDGALPHVASVQFFRRQSVAEIALYLRRSADESYTPQVVHIRAGGGLRHDLTDVKQVHLPEEFAWDGWLRIPVHNAAAVAAGASGPRRFARVSLVQVEVHYMFRNGRDLHLRGLQVLGPAEEPGAVAADDGAAGASGSGGAGAGGAGMPAWQTPAMFAGSSVR